MKREIKQVPAVFKLLGAVNLESDVKKWLEEQAATDKVAFSPCP